MAYEIQEKAGTLKIAWQGKPVFDYCFLPDTPIFESPKPYLKLYSPAGELMTLFRPHDHHWHHGFAMTLTDLSGHNFWGGATYVRGEGYKDVDNQGRQVHLGWEVQPKGGQALELVEKLRWQSFGGEELLLEERSIKAAAPKEAWLLEFESKLTNVSGQDLSIGSPTTNGREMAGYMGLMWRGPRSYLGGKIFGPKEEKDYMGTRYPWLGFQGAHDESQRRSTLVLADDPGNPRYPNPWFVRNDPFAVMSCAFAFFETLPFPKGSELRLRYRILAADGLLDAAGVQAILGGA
jgi:hypothetical protein